MGNVLVEIATSLEYVGYYLMYPDLCAARWVFGYEPAIALWARFVIVFAHAMCWVFLKTWLFRFLIPKRKHKAVVAPDANNALQTSKVQSVMQKVKHFFQKGYQKLKTRVGGKRITHRFFFWCGLEPHGQKIGCFALALHWHRFGWRGLLAMAIGAGLQASLFTLLFWLLGEEFAKKSILWILLPVALVSCILWLVRKERK